MIEFLDECIAGFIEDTTDENGEPTFVYIPERGVLVNLEVCCDTELLDAALAHLEKELTETNALLAAIQHRLTELEDTDDSKRYCVVWCDHEGSQQQRTFSNLEDACTEYNYVNEHYDGADILDESGKSVRE